MPGDVAPARRLAAALEPFVGQVYFSPECHAEYERLGFAGSPMTTSGGVAPSRRACLLHEPRLPPRPGAGQVVAAAFAVFNPAVVVPAVELLEGAGERLRPEGRPLYAGLLALDVPGTALAAAWRLADRLRECRGDSHTAAWVSAGFDAREIGLLTELFWGLPMGSYVRTRAWSDEQLDAAKARLRSRGLLDGDGFSDAGRAAGEQVEVATDRQCQPIVDAVGGALDELLATLEPWSRAIRDAGGYPPAGPHDLAGRTARTGG